MAFLKASGADGASIGRGCLGNPWIFRQARALVQGGAIVAAPTLAERGRVLVQLVEAEFRLHGSNLALRRLPRASCYFAKALPNFAAFREAVRRVRGLSDLRRLVKEHFVAT